MMYEPESQGAMPLNKNLFVVGVAKVAIVFWGAAIWVQGAGLSFVLYGPHSDRDAIFIYLVYCSIFIAGLISILSSRIATLVLFGATLAATALLLSTDIAGSRGEYTHSLSLAIAKGPALGTLILFAITLYERRLAAQGFSWKMKSFS